METKRDNQPLIAATSANSSSETVNITNPVTPASSSSSSPSSNGNGNGDGGEEGPLLSVNVQQLTLSAEPKEERKGAGLDQLHATSICGNDITASIFYSCGLVSYAAGQWAPLCFLMVAAVLFAYRFVYEEVGSALPLNGGSYSLMLNTVKRKEAAAVTASLTLLSYVATAVVCSVSAMEYLFVLTPTIPVYPGAAVILGIFALLALAGVKESARVALVIFTCHILTLSVLVLCCATWIYHADWTMYHHNISYWDKSSDVAKKIFYGFGLSLLGITGFETSANYIEEQAPGVYPKTLRNVWYLVTFFNPMITFLGMGLIPNEANYEVSSFYLSHMASRAGFEWLATWVEVDAVLVLSASVLTAFVGMQGLVLRLAWDNCFPRFLLARNKWRGTPHWTILVFLLLCLSMVRVTDGNISALGGVYTIAFATVMILFAGGLLALKWRRNKIPRSPRTWIIHPTACIVLVGAGLIGYVIENVDYVWISLIYMSISLGVVATCLYMYPLAKSMRNWWCFTSHCCRGCQRSLNRQVDQWESQIMVAFVSATITPKRLKTMLEYLLSNEEGRVIRLVHFSPNVSQPLPQSIINAYTAIPHELLREFHKIELFHIEGQWTHDAIARLAAEWKLEKNFMFIGCPNWEKKDGPPFTGLRIIA